MNKDFQLDSLIKNMANKHRPELPSPGLIWWRAQIQKKLAEKERIERPMVLMRMASVVACLAIAIVVTALNWGRATLGTIPFVTLGAHWGAKGALVGHMAGGIAFGVIAVLVVYRLIARLERDIGPTRRLPQEAAERG